MVEIRDLVARDVPRAVALVARTYPDSDLDVAQANIWAMFKKTELYPPTFIAAIESNRLVGLAGYKASWDDGRIWKIAWVNVDPDFRKRGIGQQQLINEIIERARRAEGIQLLELTTSSHDYYADHFAFRSIYIFGPDLRHRMVLPLL